MHKVIVTGISGFIGSNVAKALRDLGCYVIGIDNSRVEDTPEIKMADPDEYCVVDINDTYAVEEVFRRHRNDIEAVFHLAALPRVQFSIVHPLETNATNIGGTLVMLEVSRLCGVKAFVYSSSSSLYGDQPTLPLTEDMTPNPMSPYALQKLTGEVYTTMYAKIHDMPAVSLRYFNVYGPGQRADSAYAAAIPKFAKQMMDDEDVTVFGDGHQTRDFTYIDDVVAANISAAEKLWDGDDIKGEAYNIGGANQISVNEIIKYISSTLGKTPSVVNLDPVVESRHTKADISKARKDLSWQPKMDIKTGIRRTVESME